MTDLLDLAYPDADEAELNRRRVATGTPPKRAKPSTPSKPVAKAVYFFLTHHICDNCGRKTTAPTELYPKPFILYRVENRSLDQFVPYPHTTPEDLDVSELPVYTRETEVHTGYCIECWGG